ncbi:hypothetical protein [Streptomyces iconiensis]|uniref:Lipoprotein n=1 Tax=Streptomyces iconiensis TaxID=1384038 RepID=A0ABT7A9J9_9ACTN|nr:hypothetical protein [Streptomyces iconiensis]MDJ1138000.1 hypothetical protein [Streptomyces iconiensis]
MSRTKPGGAAKRYRVPLALLCAVAAFGPLVSGCGIRATSVPVDAGAAPSRVGCVLPGGRESPESGKGTSSVRVYLVCGSRVAPIEREVDMPDGRSSAERLPVARKLLEDLKHPPSPAEEEAGFETAVPEDLTISDGQRGDPDEALRLSTPLDELPSFALAQLVCTYADTAAADANNAVVLGGPAEPSKEGADGGDGGDGAEEQRGEKAGKPLQRFECGTALRTRPEAAETAGTRV